MSRLELVTECKHYETETHWVRETPDPNGHWTCAVGSRIPLDPDLRIVLDRYMDFRSGVPNAVTVQDVLDALENTGGGTPTTPQPHGRQ